jgi:chromosome segregation ATPase
MTKPKKTIKKPITKGGSKKSHSKIIHDVTLSYRGSASDLATDVAELIVSPEDTKSFLEQFYKKCAGYHVIADKEGRERLDEMAHVGNKLMDLENQREDLMTRNNELVTERREAEKKAAELEAKVTVLQEQHKKKNEVLEATSSAASLAESKAAQSETELKLVTKDAVALRKALTILQWREDGRCHACPGTKDGRDGKPAGHEDRCWLAALIEGGEGPEADGARDAVLLLSAAPEQVAAATVENQP